MTTPPSIAQLVPPPPHPATLTTSLSTIANKCHQPSPATSPSTAINWPEHGCTSPPTTPSNNHPIPGPSTRHLQCLQPQGTASLLAAVPDHFQLLPTSILNRHHQSVMV